MKWNPSTNGKIKQRRLSVNRDWKLNLNGGQRIPGFEERKKMGGNWLDEQSKIVNILRDITRTIMLNDPSEEKKR